MLPRVLYWVAVCSLLVGGVALRAPALHANLYADDWDHYAIENGIYPVQISSWDMFRWVGNGAPEREALLRAGRLPWWTSPKLELSVLRPLPSLLAHFDYATLDGANHPDRLHAHTLLWWCLLLFGVATLMKQVLPLPVALLATSMYAVDDCFIMPFAWVANRSEIIALALVVWALSFHLRAQASASWGLRCSVLALIGLAMCSGEHALAPLGFILAATLASPGSLRAHVRTLLPIGLIVGLYVLVRAIMGYGIAGSGFYIDPLSEPLRYLQACASRIPILLSELVFSIPCEWSLGGRQPDAGLLHRLLTFVSTGSGDFIGVGIAAGVLSLAAIIWSRRNGEHTIVWLLAGALISLLPLGGVIAAGRITTAPAIGFNACLAYLLWTASKTLVRGPSIAQRSVSLALALIVFCLALIVPMRRSHDGANYMSGMTNLERDWIVNADFGVESLAGRQVFVLSARDLASETSIPYILHAAGREIPKTATLLSPRGDDVQILTRTAEKSFELALGPPAPRKFNGSVYRTDAEVMTVGQVFRGPSFEVTVTQTSADVPSTLRFDFATSLDSSDLVFMAAREKLSRFTMPRIGERVIIPAAKAP